VNKPTRHTSRHTKLDEVSEDDNAKSDNRFRIKDWVVLALSFLAFSVSAGTAYLSVVRQEDNLSLIVRGTPLVDKDDANDLQVHFDNVSLIFHQLWNAPRRNHCGRILFYATSDRSITSMR
jgi:hypothetical protein